MTVVRFAAALGIALLMAQAVFAGWVAAGPAGDINGQVEGMTAQNDPVAGAINAVLADPTNANILYVGAVNGGIWKTYQNWQDLIVSDSGQVYRSLDGGNSFSNITGNLAGVNLHTVAIADVGATQFILVARMTACSAPHRPRWARGRNWGQPHCPTPRCGISTTIPPTTCSLPLRWAAGRSNSTISQPRSPSPRPSPCLALLAWE